MSTIRQRLAHLEAMKRAKRGGFEVWSQDICGAEVMHGPHGRSLTFEEFEQYKAQRSDTLTLIQVVYADFADDQLAIFRNPALDSIKLMWPDDPAEGGEGDDA